MSGGSFSYLYDRDADQLIECPDTWKEYFDFMSEALSEYKSKNRHPVKIKIVKLIEMIERIESIKEDINKDMANIYSVLKAVEWNHSSDICIEDVEKELEEYEPNK